MSAPRIGCSGACHGGRRPCNCGAQPPTTWRQIFEAELTHAGRWALYAGVLVASIVASWLWPMPWWGPQ